MPLRSLIITLISSLAIFWLSGFVAFYLTILSYDSRAQGHADGITVFTGGQGRIETGLELWQEGAAKHILITSVYPTLTTNDILDRRNKTLPLPACCITYDYNAKNTVQNAEETKKWSADFAPGTLFLVTSQYHMPRSLQDIRHALPDVTIKPVSIQESILSFKSVSFLCIEYHKTLYRFFEIQIQTALKIIADKF